MWSEYFSGKTVIITGGIHGYWRGSRASFAPLAPHTIVADVADSLGEDLVRTLVAEGHSGDLSSL